MIRRFATITSLLVAAKVLLQPIHINFDMFREAPTDSSGLPLPPDHIIETIRRIPSAEVPSIFASCCVATTNLGYAYEHTFKLFNFILTGCNTNLNSRNRHKLAMLFSELPQDIRNKMSAIYSTVHLQDVELEEWFRAEATPERNRPEPMVGLRAHLVYWDRKKLLHGSIYKYVDMDLRPNSQQRIRIFVPLGSVVAIERFAWELLAPRLGIYRVRNERDNE